MKLVNQLARLPEMSQVMQQMSMEMTKVRVKQRKILGKQTQTMNFRQVSWTK